MSSTRSPDDKTASPEEPEKKKVGSPGRYSLADSATAVPSTRIDSTSRMPAVRLDGVAPKSTAAVPESPPASVRQPPVESPESSSVSASADRKEPNKKPPLPPAAAAAKAGGPVEAPPSQRIPPSVAKPSTGTPIGGVRISPRAIELAMVEKRAGAPAAPTPVANDKPPATVKSPAVAAPAAPKVAPVAPAAPPIVVAAAGPVAAPPASAPASAPVAAPPASAPVSSTAGKPVSSPPKPGTELPLDALLDGFDEGSIAFAFDALVSEDSASQPGTHQFDLAPVRELFAALAANHMRHVRDFMIDVKWGDVTRDWINICLPPVRTLAKAAKHLDLTELSVALEKLGTELDASNAVGGHLLDPDEKQRLLDTYGELVTILPQAFALDSDKTQREGVIVQALLLQVPDVRKVTIDKITAAGVTTLRELFDANPNDLAHVAGIQLQLAMRIVERVQAYRTEIQSQSPQDARAAEREKLAGLTDQLKRTHDAYEAAANGWGPEAKAQKRDHFRAREETWLEISVLLARFGEVERIAGIEKVPFAQRITQLAVYLEEVRDKYREG